MAVRAEGFICTERDKGDESGMFIHSLSAITSRSTLPPTSAVPLFWNNSYGEWSGQALTLLYVHGYL